jgi:secondary thiamine-phosphate synthase enzyme
MLTQYKLSFTTQGRGFINITDEIVNCVTQTHVAIGLCHIFIHHTSASLTLCENADPLVKQDLEAFMVRLIPDGDPLYQHIDEGPDDMPSHVRAVLTQPFLMLPISEYKLALGTWQGIYLWEHRLHSHHRKLTITVQGQK